MPTHLFPNKLAAYKMYISYFNGFSREYVETRVRYLNENKQKKQDKKNSTQKQEKRKSKKEHRKKSHADVTNPILFMLLESKIHACLVGLNIEI